MKTFSFLIALFIYQFSFSQVTGAIAEDDRKITHDIPYNMTMKSYGILVFDISVDLEGNITACTFNKVESTIPTMKYRYDAKNLILTTLKFESGTRFPKFHKGQVTITGVMQE